MTGRERMRTAMLGSKPDRVPFNPQIIFTHAIRQLEKEGDYLDAIIKCYKDPDYLMQLLFEMRGIYHTDGFRIMPMYNDEFDFKKENVHYIVYAKKHGTRIGYLDAITGNIINDDPVLIKNTDDIKKIRIPSLGDFLGSIEFERLRKGISLAGCKLFKIGTVSMPIDYLVAQRGMNQAMIDLLDNLNIVQTLCEISLQIAVNKARAYIKSGIDGIYLGEAAGSSSLISPSLFCKFSLPYIKKFCEAIKPSGVILYLHICGNVRPIINMMADSGVHCIEPMDVLGGMNPSEFRQKVGNRVSLMGGVNTVTLAKGTPDDVEREAKQCIDEAGINGGYIMAAADMVPFEASRENVYKMFEVASSHTY